MVATTSASSDPRRLSVLLLAGEAREAWTAALTAAGFDVRSTGWLDAVTAARLQRPDAVVVSDDLAGGAVGTLRKSLAAPELKKIPVLMACLPPDDPESADLEPFFGYRYLTLPVDVNALGSAVQQAIREGRHPRPIWLLLKVPLALIALLFLFCAAILASSWVRQHPERISTLGRVLLVAGTGLLLVTAIAAVRNASRSLRIKRTAVAMIGVLFFALASVYERLFGRVAEHAMFTGSCLVLGMWSYLGVKMKPRRRGWRLWYLGLAAVLLLGGVVQWATLLFGK